MNLLEKADYLTNLIPGYQYLYSSMADTGVIPQLLANSYGCNAGDSQSAAAAYAGGLAANDIYFTQPDKQREQIKQCIGKCRLVTGSLEELQIIDEIAAKHLAEGYLEVVGLQVIPEAYDDGHQYGFRIGELRELAASFRKLQHISIRGCFIEGPISTLRGPELVQHYRRCYEAAKQVTTAIPCGMSYVCFGACTDAVYQSSLADKDCLPEIAKAAEIVRHQNDTAFYARLLVL